MAIRDATNYQELLDFVSKYNGVAIIYFHSYVPSYPAPVLPAN